MRTKYKQKLFPKNLDRILRSFIRRLSFFSVFSFRNISSEKYPKSKKNIKFQLSNQKNVFKI
ncbi:hypothetical protein A0O34_21305 [Chryseobacterium glaciei]|uniref:Uncharacterized protein n=1 Tax=Chryseobacterium glaciei TaxID=1685010 RepID=A0A172Y116_9FLAO|nr:hypothetical protein A0O34_21305 [Chryseobacterium glaciei]